MALLRSLLFVPGNQPKMLEKAVGLAPDAYVADLEDSVPSSEKADARRVAASFLPRLSQAGPSVVVRVNAVDSGLMEDDLSAVVGPHIFGVSVGKVGSGEDIRRISDAIESVEKKAGLEPGSVRVIPWIETAMGMVNAYEICRSSPRIAGVAFGAEDFTNDMEIQRTGEDLESAYPRSVVSVAARAAGVLALDTPYFAFRDADGLRRESQRARGYGFKGKFAIHPSQIEIINEAFSPSVADVEQARRVVEAFEEAARGGRGSTSLGGMVIDVPVVERARKLIDLASAISRRGSAGVDVERR